MLPLTKVFRCDRAATAIEYALIASLVSIAAIAAMGNLGTKTDAMLNNVASAMN